jgi:DnaJ-class molecular chaperone
MGEYWYHGTIKKYVNSIKKNGFDKGTYFTQYFDSAFTMGGPYVFSVYFKETPTKYWEYISTEVISPNRIESLRFITTKLLYYNKEISRQLKKDDLKNGEKFCEKCNGHGELTYRDNGHHLLPRGCSWKNRRKIVACPDCNGYGVLKIK